jgi:hypothetical protein
MTAKLLKPLAVIEKDIQAIVFITLSAGATVEFRQNKAGRRAPAG